VAKAVGLRAKICQVPYLPIDGEQEIPKGYDVRDAIQRGATASDFLKAVSQGKRLEEKLFTEVESATSPPLQTNPKQIQLQNLRRLYAHRLRKNLRGYQIEKDGQPVYPDHLYLECLEQDGILISKDRAIDIFNFFASANEYDPVADYLNACYAQYGNSTVSLLNSASSRYLHTDKPIYDIYLRKTLIGAVKRTFKPGCKFDTALVLFGNQGYGKSTFWRILAGEWFDDTVSGFDQNEVHKLHYFWIEELGEIDRIQNKHDVSIVKAFLSQQVDAFRPVFTRSVCKFPRRFIIVGSTNKQEILLDSTGDRRFWIIPITKPINNDLVKVERDQLWAAAVALYKAGEDCYLTTELELLRDQENENYRVEDPWHEIIANHVNSRQSLRTSEILTDVLQIPIERQDRRAQMRVADILRSLGWAKRHTRQGKIWEKTQHQNL
jgi:predicted P-loop ATPase